MALGLHSDDNRVVFSKELISRFVKAVMDLVPCKSDERLKEFISRLHPISAGTPDVNNPVGACYRVEDWFFCLRRYEETSLKLNYLEIWVGRDGAYWGWLRLNPYFYDDQGRNRKVWEITHAFAYPKVRGRGINRLYAALALEMARANMADLLVANPRHVAMLVVLSDMGFSIRGATGTQQSVKRIVKQGRVWNAGDANARRLYYAQEMRSFMADGGMMMEKDLAHERFWKIF
jgi:hypothetical protein